MASPTWTYEVRYYLDTSSTSTPAWTFVDYDSAFDPSRDNDEYEASYKARRTQPKWVTSQSFNIEFGIDIVENETLQDWFVAHEDDVNQPTKVLRVWPEEVSSGTYPAKMAAFNMTENPLDGGAGEPVKATGTLNMIDDGWTIGTVTYSSGVPVFAPTV